MRNWFLGLLACVAAVGLCQGAQAQATKGPAQAPTQVPAQTTPRAPAQGLDFPDGKYASLAAYLAGTWKWERQEPRQSMIMRFGPGNAFFFHNFTIDLQHWGTYQATNDMLAVFLTRSCSEKGSNCNNRSPPEKMEFSFKPIGAHAFTSSSERWERIE